VRWWDPLALVVFQLGLKWGNEEEDGDVVVVEGGIEVSPLWVDESWTLQLQLQWVLFLWDDKATLLLVLPSFLIY
jgi:hypothetical protein